MPEPTPTHFWNDPDGDGHDCIDCDFSSIWKCDEAAHLLPDILPPDERKRLDAHLDELRRARIGALSDTGRQLGTIRCLVDEVASRTTEEPRNG